MAEIADNGGGGHGKGKKRAKKGSTKVDMTPLVDLAFLLLTFFVLTSTFSKPKVMSLVYPAKVPKEQTPTDNLVNEAITFVLSENRVFYYLGEFRKEPKNGKPATKLEETNFGSEGVRKLLIQNNYLVLNRKNELDQQLRKKVIADTTYERLLKEIKSNKDALTVLIKTDNFATCKNFIDLVDELKIADIGRIAPVEAMQSEIDLVTEITGKK